MLPSDSDSAKLYASIATSIFLSFLYCLNLRRRGQKLLLENLLNIALAVVAIVSSFDLILTSIVDVCLRENLSWDDLSVLVFGSFSVVFLATKQIVQIFREI
jgi:uncharacterized protein YhhL (DUF1145 family)